jgi:hypothetical protein
MADYGRSSYRLGPTGSKIVIAIFAVVLGIFSADTYFKYQALASEGRETTATVVSYNPVITHGRNGSTVHYYHVLSFDGITSRVELFRQLAPGTKTNILYLPDRPSVAAEGKKGMSAFELMGTGNVLLIAMFGGFAVFFLLMFFGVFPMQQAQYTGGGIQAGSQPVMQDLAGQAGQDTAARPQADEVFPRQDNAVPFAPGGPQTADDPAQQGQAMAGYDSAVNIMLAQLKGANITANTTLTELISKENPSLSDRQVKEAYDRARAMIAAAEEMADDIQDGIYTREQAIKALMKSNPGFSQQSYEAAADSAIKQE